MTNTQTASLHRQKVRDKFLNNLGFYTCLTMILFVTLFPFLWMILASFKSHVDLMSLDKLVVFTPTTENYKAVFTRYSFKQPLINSTVVATCTTLAALVISLPAAYAIAKFKMNKTGAGILMTRMVPAVTFLLPWFMIFSNLGLTDTYLSLVLAYMLVAVPFIIWIMVPNFENLPSELEQAAMIDGCTMNQTFLKIMLPLSIPGIITASLMSFIYSWNNFLFALALAGYNTKTLPIAVFNFIGYAEIDWGSLMAAAVIITGPIVLLSLLLQKYVVSGITAGAVKG